MAICEAHVKVFMYLILRKVKGRKLHKTLHNGIESMCKLALAVAFGLKDDIHAEGKAKVCFLNMRDWQKLFSRSHENHFILPIRLRFSGHTTGKKCKNGELQPHCNWDTIEKSISFLLGLQPIIRRLVTNKYM